jgi:excisionase family DNA binding protein
MNDSIRPTATNSTAELLPLLTVREAAKVLRVCDRTLWTLTQEGGIPAVKVGRSVRYDQADLAKWTAGQNTV